MLLLLPVVTSAIAMMSDGSEPKENFGFDPETGKLLKDVSGDPSGYASYFLGTWRWELGGDPLPREILSVRVASEGGVLQYKSGSRLSPGRWYLVVETVPGSRRLGKEVLVLSVDTPTENAFGDSPELRLVYNAKNRAFSWFWWGDNGASVYELPERGDEILAPAGGSIAEGKNAVLLD